MWSIDFLPDPLDAHRHQHQNHDVASNGENGRNSLSTSSLATASISLRDFFGSNHLAIYDEVQAGGRGAQVALADFCARRLLSVHPATTDDIQLETLDQWLVSSKGRRKRRNGNGNKGYPPYVVERSDVYCHDDNLHLMLRMTCQNSSPNTIQQLRDVCTVPCQTILSKTLDVHHTIFRSQLLSHVATVVLQQRVRSHLTNQQAVAFLANGSILPRRSGTSSAPMASPPAVPFQAPVDSPMSQSISVDMGGLAKYLPSNSHGLCVHDNTVTLSGLIVPGGITLICGGGYHGKSTTLQAISLGVYDKIPGDGREFCVSVASAVTVRAEDGRYVNNCNISAFISNLPTPPGTEKALDTQHFSSRDASGSTSQATNVVEAIEMGATAMLVDEDVSAANFMARDGRMRALVMDESITPLLYRVNGLYNTHKVSSVVVVGGVGDWLDVPHNVLLLDKYIARDATKKAQSISYQFSYGHVQYAGRGVVHRLEWEKSGTPIPRRPVDSFAQQYDFDVAISILDGGRALSLHKDDENDVPDDNNVMQVVDDDDEGCVDASRVQQFLSKRQLYGAGICLAWLLQQAPKNPRIGLKSLLHQLDMVLDKGGMNGVLNDLRETTTNGSKQSKAWMHMLETVGFLERPRSFEIGQVLTRLHGIQLEEIPIEDDGSEDAARLEEERKKKVLADLWAKRRSNNNEAQ